MQHKGLEAIANLDWDQITKYIGERAALRLVCTLAFCRTQDAATSALSRFGLV